MTLIKLDLDMKA